MSSSSDLSQLPQSQSSNPPSDFELPDGSTLSKPHKRPLRLQRPCKSPREVRPLPFELQEQTRIFFEETLYGQALRLLQCMLTAGYTNNLQEWRPAFVAPPVQLALIATLAVHPSLTTATTNPHKLAASVEAMRYLRLVHTMVGPLESDLCKAYRFMDRGSSTRRGMFIRQRSPSPEAMSNEINSVMASSESIWTLGKNFWSVVGWAFNCSAQRQNRWPIYQTWLDHMLTLIYEDWLLNCLDPDQSLLVSYIRGHDARKIMRAVFADGTKSSVQEFGEVWRNEAAPPRIKRRKHEKVEINFELDEFGDYLRDSSEDEDDGKADHTIENGSFEFIVDATAEDTASLGNTEAIELRMRLLAVLSEVASQSLDAFLDIEGFAVAFISSVKSLSLRDFRGILSIFSLDYLSLPVASLLIQSVTCSFIESTAPRSPSEEFTQDILAQAYLPWAANTISALDNGKLSACLETLLRLYLTTHTTDTWDESLLESLHSGIQRREGKAQRSAKTKTESDGQSKLTDFQWLVSSGERLQRLAQCARFRP